MTLLTAHNLCDVLGYSPRDPWSTTRQLTIDIEFKTLTNSHGRIHPAPTCDHAAATLSPETQQRLEQFLTPAPVADQAASLFTPTRQPVHILDLGSGTGILAAAVAERSADGSSVVAVEQDANLAADSERTLYQVCHNTKVINASVLETLLDPVFDCVILTPHTRKSVRRVLVSVATPWIRKES